VENRAFVPPLKAALGTDHLDVLYTHWQTPDLSIFPLEETVEAMMKLKEQGKIRACARRAGWKQGFVFRVLPSG